MPAALGSDAVLPIHHPSAVADDLTASHPTTVPLRACLARLADPRLRRPLIAAVALVVLGLTAWGVMNAADPARLRDSFTGVSWPWIVAACAAYAATQVTSALVWKVGLDAGGLGAIGRGHVIRAHWLGRGACELLPAHLGEAVRYAAVRRHPAADGGGMRIAGSMSAFKILDGVVTFAVVAAATTVAPLPSGFTPIRWAAGLMLGGLIVSVILLWRFGGSRLAILVPRRARGLLDTFGRGAGLLACRRSIVVAAGLQLGAIGLRILSLAALLAAFGLPAAAAPLVFGLMIVSGYLAISPGGAGVREAAVVPVLVTTYGLTAAPVLAFSLGVQAIALVVSVAGALVALALDRRAGASAPAPALA
jgi:uncharacterized membrane protein YbhN (UPF0104 family)